MPRKVWVECMDCPKFPKCDEIAMILDEPFLPVADRGESDPSLRSRACPEPAEGTGSHESEFAEGKGA